MKDIQTGFRISEIQNNKVSEIAKECGLSKNSTLKMLVALGIQAFQNARANLPESPVQRHEKFHTQQ